jgi:hypothetical protein
LAHLFGHGHGNCPQVQLTVAPLQLCGPVDVLQKISAHTLLLQPSPQPQPTSEQFS